MQVRNLWSIPVVGVADARETEERARSLSQHDRKIQRSEHNTPAIRLMALIQLHKNEFFKAFVAPT